jgi:hypothetical protein
MRLLAHVAALAAALFAMPAVAQVPARDASGVTQTFATTKLPDGTIAANTVPIVPAATSIPLEADVTASGVSVVSACTVGGIAGQPCGAASFSGGVATMGLFTPILGRDLRIIIRPTTAGSPWTGTVQVGTSTAANACAANTINPLTIGGQTWGSYTGNANEVVDTPTLWGVAYCVTVTMQTGSARVAVRQ